MDSQNYCNTFADLQTGTTDQLYPIERTECNGEYWNDLIVEALGPNSHDGMPSNVDGDFGSDHQTMGL